MCNLEVTHWFLLFLLHNKIFRTLQTFIFTWQSFLLCETDVLMGQKCCCAQDMSSHLGNDFAFFMFLNCGRPLKQNMRLSRDVYNKQDNSKLLCHCGNYALGLPQKLPGTTLSAIDIWEFFMTLLRPLKGLE